MFVLIKWDGNKILLVHGPFDTPQDAWKHAHDDNNGGVIYSIGLRFSVNPIHKPLEVP